MNNKLSLILISIFSIFVGQSQTFTIEQNVTGQNNLTDVRGQSFTPVIQGSGSGDVGSNDTVYLNRFSIIYSFSSTSEADTLYIYSAIPDSTYKIDNGKGGVLIGKSITKEDGEFPYTDYAFNSIPLHKDSTYYVLFKENINPEASAGSSYAGGSAVRNRADTLSFSDFLDLKFIAGFSRESGSETDIVSFSVGSQVGNSAIDNDAHTVSTVIESYSSLDSVSTIIEVSQGATYQPANTYIDCSDGPIIYTVTAEDGITTQEWTVTVTKAPSIYDIESFSLPQQTGEATILYGKKEINIEVWYGTDLGSLTPTIIISEGATIDPNSGIQTDFSSGPVIYTVTAEDGITTQEWTVNITNAPPSMSTDIESFSLPQQTGEASILYGNKEIEIEVGFGTDLDSLTPTIVVSGGATIDPNSGIPTDFSSGPIIYTVTAEDGITTQEWTVNVTNTSSSSSSSANIESFSLPEQTGEAIIDSVVKTIDIELEAGTVLSTLTPEIEVSEGAILSIGKKPLWTGTSMAIGSMNSGEFFTGKIDDILIYNYALSDDQVNDLYITGNFTESGDMEEKIMASYPFNGNANDESGNGNDGIVDGPILTTDRFGSNNSAYYFDSSAIIIPTYSYFNNMQAFSICAWIYPEQLKQRDNTIISKVNPNRDFNLKILKTNNKYEGHFAKSATYYRCYSKDDVILNEWTHIVLIWTGSRWRLHTNGVLETESKIFFEEIDSSGAVVDFSSGPIVYNVTAEDGITTQEWTVNVTVEEVTSSIVSNDRSNYRVYPTIFKNELNIFMDNHEKALVKIYNSTGQLVVRAYTNNSLSKINTSSFSQGMYFLKLGDNRNVKKIIKK